MNCCGEPLIFDQCDDGEPIIWCPKCGRDFTYQYYEEQCVKHNDKHRIAIMGYQGSQGVL